MPKSEETITIHVVHDYFHEKPILATTDYSIAFDTAGTIPRATIYTIDIAASRWPTVEEINGRTDL